MARDKKRTPQVEAVRAYVAGGAQNLVDKRYGPTGPAWGTKRAAIADGRLDIRAVLTEQMLDLTLAQPAAAVDPPSP